MISVLTALILCQIPAAAPAEPERPPSIVYGTSRSSTEWVTLRNGTAVPVDRGIEWRGVKVYLSLLSDLVAVDAASGEVLWSRMVGAYWNEVSFQEIELPGGQRKWAVSLRPGPAAAQERGPVQYHDLVTGEKLVPLGAAERPAGRPFEPRVFSGENSGLTHRFQTWITTPENWKICRQTMFGEDCPDLGDVDFETEVVLVLSYGDSVNCLGVGAVAAYEDESRILLRIRNRSVQSGPEGIRTRPYGMFILPRTAKTYVVERDVQSFIAGPPIWKECSRTVDLPSPAQQIRPMLRPV